MAFGDRSVIRKRWRLGLFIITTGSVWLGCRDSGFVSKASDTIDPEHMLVTNPGAFSGGFITGAWLHS